MSNSLDADQARYFVGPYLGPNCLQRLLADDTIKQKFKDILHENLKRLIIWGFVCLFVWF